MGEIPNGICEDLNFRRQQSDQAKGKSLDAFRRKEKDIERHEEIVEIVENIRRNGIPNQEYQEDNGFASSGNNIINETVIGKSNIVDLDIKKEEKRKRFLENHPVAKKAAAAIITLGVITGVNAGLNNEVSAADAPSPTKIVQEKYTSSSEVLIKLGLNQEIIKSSPAFQKMKDFIAGGKFGECDFDGTMPLKMDIFLNNVKTGGKPTLQRETSVMLSPEYMNEVCKGKNFNTVEQLTTYIKSVVEGNNALKNFKDFMGGRNACFYFTDQKSFYCFSASGQPSAIDYPYIIRIDHPENSHCVRFTNDGKSRDNQRYLVRGGDGNESIVIDSRSGKLVVVNNTACQITGDCNPDTGEIKHRNEFENVGNRQEVFDDMVTKVEGLRKDGTLNFDHYITLKDSSGNDIFEVAIGGTDGLDQKYVDDFLKPAVGKFNRIDSELLKNFGPKLILKTTGDLNATYDGEKSVNKIYLNQDNVSRTELKEEKNDRAVTLYSLLTESDGLKIRMFEAGGIKTETGEIKYEGFLKSIMARETIEEWYNRKLISDGEYKNLKKGADNDTILYIIKEEIQLNQKDEIYRSLSEKYGISDANRWTSELCSSILGPKLKDYWNM